MVCLVVVMVDCDCVLYIVVVCFGDIWRCSFVVTILLSLILFGEGQMSFVPAGLSFPGRSLERDLQMFDEFALFAIDKWYQLPANTPAIVAGEWCLAPLRVDLEDGQGFVLESSSCDNDSGEGSVYSSSSDREGAPFPSLR